MALLGTSAKATDSGFDTATSMEGALSPTQFQQRFHESSSDVFGEDLNDFDVWDDTSPKPTSANLSVKNNNLPTISSINSAMPAGSSADAVASALDIAQKSLDTSPGDIAKTPTAKPKGKQAPSSLASSGPASMQAELQGLVGFPLSKPPAIARDTSTRSFQSVPPSTTLTPMSRRRMMNLMTSKSVGVLDLDQAQTQTPGYHRQPYSRKPGSRTVGSRMPRSSPSPVRDRYAPSSTAHHDAAESTQMLMDSPGRRDKTTSVTPRSQRNFLQRPSRDSTPTRIQTISNSGGISSIDSNLWKEKGTAASPGASSVEGLDVIFPNTFDEHAFGDNTFGDNASSQRHADGPWTPDRDLFSPKKREQPHDLRDSSFDSEDTADSASGSPKHLRKLRQQGERHHYHRHSHQHGQALAHAHNHHRHRRRQQSGKTDPSPPPIPKPPRHRSASTDSSNMGSMGISADESGPNESSPPSPSPELTTNSPSGRGQPRPRLPRKHQRARNKSMPSMTSGLSNAGSGPTAGTSPSRRSRGLVSKLRSPSSRRRSRRSAKFDDARETLDLMLSNHQKRRASKSSSRRTEKEEGGKMRRRRECAGTHGRDDDMQHNKKRPLQSGRRACLTCITPERHSGHASNDIKGSNSNDSTDDMVDDIFSVSRPETSEQDENDPNRRPRSLSRKRISETKYFTGANNNGSSSGSGSGSAKHARDHAHGHSRKEKSRSPSGRRSHKVRTHSTGRSHAKHGKSGDGGTVQTISTSISSTSSDHSSPRRRSGHRRVGDEAADKEKSSPRNARSSSLPSRHAKGRTRKPSPCTKPSGSRRHGHGHSDKTANEGSDHKNSPPQAQQSSTASPVHSKKPKSARIPRAPLLPRQHACRRDSM